MGGVLTGFAALAAVVLLGYLLARSGILPAGSDRTLAILTFYAATPALLYRALADADVAAVFSAGALVTIITAVTLAAVYVLLATLVLGRRGPEVTLGAYAASYVNAGNLGIPILVFAVGDAAAIAPVLLLQLLVMVPVGFAVLDSQVGRRGSSWGQTLTAPVRNPLVVGVALGLLAGLTGARLPTVLQIPVDMVADMAVPVMLIAFGISLRGSPLPGRGEVRAPMWVAVVLKTLVGPALAYVLGSRVFGLSGTALAGPVVVAALPTAQNIFVYAMRYGRAVPLSRDAILISTLVCVPVVVTVTALLT